MLLRCQQIFLLLAKAIDLSPSNKVVDLSAHCYVECQCKVLFLLSFSRVCQRQLIILEVIASELTLGLVPSHLQLPQSLRLYSISRLRFLMRLHAQRRKTLCRNNKERSIRALGQFACRDLSPSSYHYCILCSPAGLIVVSPPIIARTLQLT
jgi:hypothetical protein